MSIREVSDESTISFLFLQKIAKQLREAGIIQASRGSRGGYMLAKKPEQITMKEVLEAVEGPQGLTACVRGEYCAKESICTIQKGVKKMNRELMHLLGRTPVADMIA